MNLILSTNQTKLCEKLLNILKEKPLKNPFSQDVILTQSFAMNHYLTLEISKSLGIAMGMQMLYPKVMIKMLYRELLAEKEDITKVNPWEIKNFQWVFMKILRKIEPKKKEREHFSLAKELVQIFNDYLLYRNPMLEKWETDKKFEKNKTVHWQKTIWKKARLWFPKEQYPHYIQQTEKIIDLLAKDLDKSTKEKLHKICPRIFIFGISRVIPGYLDLWEKLSKHVDVFVFALDHHHHQKTKNNDERETLSSVNQEEATKENWKKKQEKWFIETLKQKASKIEKIEWNCEEKGFLSALKRVYLKNPSSQDIKSLMKPDHTLMIKKCANKTREVEAMRDILLHLFRETEEGDKKNALPLNANDVLVMAPEINNYTSLIRGMLERAGIPFSIADERLDRENAFFEELLCLLSLLKDNLWQKNKILNILSSEYLSKKWDFYDYRKEIASWIEKARIKWGKKDHGNCWQIGIKRLMLGYCMWLDDEYFATNEEKKLSQPPFFFEGSIAEELGNFLQFLSEIESWSKKVSGQRTLKKWCDTTRTIISEFFKWQNTTEKNPTASKYLAPSIEEIYKKIHLIEKQEPFLGKNCEKISLETFLSVLQQELESPLKERGFMTRGVTFSSLSPMRAIPFPVIYLLGMGEEDFFHKEKKESSINLMLEDRQPYDRAKRIEDRQLFFEALLSAKKFFFLSYNEKNDKNIKQNYPTEIFLELLENATDFLQKHIEIKDDELLEKITYTVPLHAYDAKNFDEIETNAPQKEFLLRSISLENFNLAKVLNEPKEEINFGKNLISHQNKTKKVFLKELIDFYSNPLKKKLEQLGAEKVSLPKIDEDLEPLYPNDFDHSTQKPIWGNYNPETLANQKINHKYFWKQPKINWESIKKEGIFPYGAAGKEELKNINEALLKIFNNATEICSSLENSIKKKEWITIKTGDTEVEGLVDFWINKHNNQKSFFFCCYQKKSKEIKINDLIFWLFSSLLIFHHAQDDQSMPKKSFFITNEERIIFKSSPELLKKNLLEIYIKSFLEEKVIFFPPKTTASLFKADLQELIKDEIEKIKKKWFNEIELDIKKVFYPYYKDLLQNKKDQDLKWKNTLDQYYQFLNPLVEHIVLEKNDEKRNDNEKRKS